MLILFNHSPYGIGMTEDKKSVFYNESKWNKRKKHLCIKDKSPKNIKIGHNLDLNEAQKEVQKIVHDSDHSCRTFVDFSLFPNSCNDNVNPHRLKFVDKSNGSHSSDKICYRCGRYNYDRGTFKITEEGIILSSENVCQKCSTDSESNHFGGRTASISNTCIMNPNMLIINKTDMNSPLCDIKINTVDEIEDVVKRYQNNCSGNGNSLGNHMEDEGVFCDMPKLERQDIYDPNVDALNDLYEGERDMCALEIEADLSNTVSGSSENVSLEVFGTGKYSNHMKFSNNNISSIHDLVNQEDHSRIIPTISCAGEEPRASRDVTPEKHHFNVTLLKTSNNCYKVKDLSDDYQSVNATSSEVLQVNETDSSETDQTKLKNFSNNKNSVLVNEDHSWSTHLNYKKIRKSRKYSKQKRKRNHVREFSFDKLQSSLLLNDKEKSECFANELINSDSDSGSGGSYSNTVPLSKLYTSDKKPEVNSSSWHKPCAEINGFKSSQNSRVPCELASVGNDDDSIWLFKRVKPVKRKAVSEPADFLGFKDDEILSLSVKVMYFKMNLTSSSPLSFVFNGKEVTLRQSFFSSVDSVEGINANVSPHLEQTMGQGVINTSTPTNLMDSGIRFLSPVNSVEKTNAKASQHLEQSVLDLGAMNTCTPTNVADCGIRFLSPVDTVERINANASHHLEQSILDLGEINTSTPTNFMGSSDRLLSTVDTVRRPNSCHQIEANLNDLNAMNPNTPKNVSITAIRSRRQLFSESPIVSPTLSEAHDTSIIEISSIDGKNDFSRDMDSIDYFDEQLDLDEVGVQNKPLCLAACGVTSQESLLITKLARLTNSSLSSGFTNETTHLIVGDGAWGSKDYLLAIAYRVYIVTIDWVTQCLNQNSIIPPEPFIPISDEGPLKCIQHISPPFIGMYVFFQKPLSSSNYDDTYEFVKTLCSMGGATVILDYEQFPLFHEDTRPRFFIFEEYSQVTQYIIDKCKELKLVPLSSNWVKSSICSYEAEPIIQYLGGEMSPRELAFEYNIPITLLKTSQHGES